MRPSWIANGVVDEEVEASTNAAHVSAVRLGARIAACAALWINRSICCMTDCLGRLLRRAQAVLDRPFNRGGGHPVADALDMRGQRRVAGQEGRAHG